MKIRSTILFLLSVCGLATAQSTISEKDQGLLWEISGKNLKKPSYLFGTMHVSSKVAFHLGDAFYASIKNVDVVALETNPDHMQDDYTESIFQKLQQESYRSAYLSAKTFSLNDYKRMLQAALAYEPEMVNHLLYRSYLAKEDFEENTFLDLYIYQVGKRLGKRATGVENFRESEQLVLEAFRDMAEEAKKKKKDNSYDEDDYRMLNGNTLTDAYRSGNLDLLDSLSRKQYRSEAFLEKFLYKRNENMFHAIDSIIQKTSLFAGVGAAHLPGQRGLLVMLRKAGYTVKPVKMGERDSEQKKQIDQMRVERTFATQTAEDGWFSVDVPGKLYNFLKSNMIDQRQYADLANGTYYVINRVKTHASFLEQSEDYVLKRIDSLLYEHIPGTILSRTPITKNGYQGFDIKNRSRRGDLQRYQILVTPLEIFIFKMSGNENYIEGKEAEVFFNSIRLKEMPTTSWKVFTPVYGGFQIRFPHEPLVSSQTGSFGANSWEALDKSTGFSYLVARQAVTNYAWLEEDTTDLSVAEESFLASASIKKVTSRKFLTYKGHPCLEITARTHTDKYLTTRLLLKGISYYMVAASYAREKDRKNLQPFFESFNLPDFTYPEWVSYQDTALKFSVTLPAGCEPNEKEKLSNLYSDTRSLEEPGTEDYQTLTKVATLRSEETGEEVRVEYERFSKYVDYTDKNQLWNALLRQISENKIIAHKEMATQGDLETCLVILKDTNTSRCLLYKWVLRKQVLYTLMASADTAAKSSAFVQRIMDTFKPTDAPIGESVFVSKVDLFFTEFTSKDVELRQKAKGAAYQVDFRDADAPRLIQLIQKLNPKEKGYLDTKRLLIYQLSSLKHAEVVPFLQQAYTQTNDTTTLEYAILHVLAKHQTQESCQVLKNIFLNETPIFASRQDLKSVFYALSDSLELTRTMFPDLLKLASLADYKESVYSLLAQLVEKKQIPVSTYESYLNQIVYDARTEAKRQFAQEEERQIEEEAREEEDPDYSYTNKRVNDELTNFAILLAPALAQNKTIQKYFNRLLQSSDKASLTEVIGVLLKNNHPVPDSLLLSIAADPRYRSDLFTTLESIQRLDRFPKKYYTQEALARSLVYEKESYSASIDTVVYLSKQQTGFALKKGTVYFYKYKKPKKDDWYIAISGLQPLTDKQVTAQSTLVRLTDTKIKSGKTVSEQLGKALKTLKLERRVQRSAKEEYEID